MILYFSGTGNSEYAAKRIGNEINDQVVNLFEKIRSRDFAALQSSRPWVVVAPTYAWRIPRIVEEWLQNTPLTGSKDIYFVMTCGGNIGNADQYLKKLCAAKGLNDRGCFEILMGENYVAMFTTPTQAQALQTLEQAKPAIDKAAQLIKSGKPFPRPAVTLKDKLDSGFVNDVFYPLFVHAKKFYATSACISCGKCAKLCPLNNIRLENGKPVWGKSCTHCMACICRCPSEAIEYGEHSKGMPRYVCPKTL